MNIAGMPNIMVIIIKVVAVSIISTPSIYQEIHIHARLILYSNKYGLNDSS